MNDGDDEWMAFTSAELLYAQRKAQHELVNRLRFQAMQLLIRAVVWAAVEALASSLVRHQVLNAKQAYGVIRAVLPGISR